MKELKNLPSFDEFINEERVDENILTPAKDRMRLVDIVKKAGGSGEKEANLAMTMANRITDVDKAVHRAEAAIDIEKFELAQIFLDRAALIDPTSKDRRDYWNVKYECDKYFTDKKNRENYEAHLKGLEGTPDLNIDGVFYNVGIPTLHRQKDNPNIKAFRYALMRIVQNLVNQMHVYIEPMSYDEQKGKLIVRVSPNFTYPKNKVMAAYKEYPKVLADYLNKAYGEDVVKSSKGEIVITKDINHKKLVMSVLLTDIKTGDLKLD